MRHIHAIAVMAIGILAGPVVAAPPADTFPLRDGDIWVMAGDSITAQHLHSNYIEAFCYARYPKLRFAFRNSGVGGHTIPTTLARFDYDIAAWKPTIVSVELGMNDSGGTATDKFVANMGTMVTRIRAAGARPVILSASPVNDGTTLAKLAGRNQRLDEYATALKTFCDKEQILYADQFHALIDVWGHNKPSENLVNTLASVKQLAADDTLTGVDHLRAFLIAQEKAPIKPISMQGDPVHPGPPGQLMMAAALLKALGADGFVSSATIDISGTVDAKGCAITGVTAKDGTLSFDRLDESSPFPIADNARAVLPLAPEIRELNQYTLKVTGLKAEDYQVRINGVASGRVTAQDLTAGINLTALPSEPNAAVNPLVVQGRAILAAVTAKEQIVGNWRTLSQKAHAADAPASLKVDLADLTKKVEEADTKIREAAKPQVLHFVVAPFGS